MFLFHRKSWHPKYWVLAIILCIFWLLAHLPRRLQAGYGRALGRRLFALKKIRQVTTTNIRLCYPKLTDKEVQIRALNSAQQLGIALAETFIVWFRNIDCFLKGNYCISGKQYLKTALDENRGVILLSMHFGSVDLNTALVTKLNFNGRKFFATYRKSDEIVNRFLKGRREKIFDHLLSSTDQRAIVKALKGGDMVWYAPDIEVKGKNSAFVDFMGIKASTTFAISRLAKVTGAKVVPIVHYRENNTLNYKLCVYPALENFPSNDPIKDTRAINQQLEAMLAPQPDMYWWAIKRFKHRPEGEARIY